MTAPVAASPAPGSGAPESDAPAGRTLARHTLAYLVARSVPAALTLLSVPYFVRMLGHDQYGHYSLYASLSLLSGNVAGSWLTQSVLRHHSGLSVSAPAAYAGAVRRGAAYSVAAAGVATALLGLLLPPDPASLALAAVGAMAMAAFLVVFATRQASLDVVGANVADTVRTVLVVAVPAALMVLPAWRTPAVLLLGIVVGSVAGAVVPGGARAPRATGGLEPHGRPAAVLRQLWAFGGPLAGWMFVSILLNVSDRYIIERILGTESVGTYSAVYDVVFKGVAFAFMPVLMAAHPAIMTEWNAGNREGAARMVRRTSGWSVVLAAVVLLAVGATAGPLAAFVSGSPDPLSRALVLPIAVGAAAWQIAMLVHKPLELQHRTWAMLGAAGIGLAANWGLNVALLPRLGLVASAYSTAAGGVLYLALVAALSSTLTPRN